MTLDDFTHLLDRCGGDPAGWPPGAKPAAHRLLSGSPEARTALAGVQALDRLIAATRVQVAPDGLVERAARGAQASRPTAARLWARAVGVAAAAAVTLSLGLVTGAAERAPTPDQAVAAALDTPLGAPSASGAVGEAGDAG